MKPTLIVALNPSIDTEWRVDDVLWEEKNNITSEARWAGGKGINVTRWIQHLGGKSRLIAPLGGATGAKLVEYLRAENISLLRLRVTQPTRVNVIVTTATGRQMRFNPLGPKLSAPEQRAVICAVENQIKRASILILSGSLPRGFASDTYAGLIRFAHRHGVKTLLDCDGSPFTAAISARPFLVKPNEHELSVWFGKSLKTERSVVAASKQLSAQTGGWVFVSRGGKRSHLVNTSEGIAISAQPAKIKPLNTVGAGDALLAGVAVEISKGSPPASWLKRGLEVGTAATQLQPGKLPDV